MSRLQKYYESTSIRHYFHVVAFVVLGLSFATSAVLLYTSVSAPEMPTPQESLGNVHTGYTATTLEPALPVRLIIEKLSIDAPFEEPLGLDGEQKVAVPKSFEHVGWYKYSPTPGERGPSVILGHVDSRKGLAVFFYLGQLTVGDEIQIERDDGSRAQFSVTAIERYERDVFPKELVYGNIDHAGLRLVTCSGDYDRDEAHYSHNLVIYAALIDETDINESL